jgi:hypothetical protein
MRRIMVLGVLLLLAGCAKPLEVGSITEIKPPPGTQGVDIYASRRAAGEKVPDFAGDQLMEVRTFAQTEGGGSGDEFAGAQCKVSSRDFSADVTTPAKIRVPVYRAQSSPLAVQCTKDGFKPKLAEVAVFNETKAGRMQSAGNGGLIGVLMVTAINAASDETTHDFKYPVARVLMEPLSFGKTASNSASGAGAAPAN